MLMLKWRWSIHIINGIYKRILASTRGSHGSYSDLYNYEGGYKCPERESQDSIPNYKQR